jgi:hypothetical protein
MFGRILSRRAVIACAVFVYVASGYVAQRSVSVGEDWLEWADPDEIARIGDHLCAAGEFGFVPGQPSVLRAPAYPGAVALMCRLTGADTFSLLPIVNGLCHLLLLLVIASHPLMPTGPAGIATIAAVGLDPLLLNYAGRGYLEPMLLAAVALVVASIDRLVRHPTAANGLLLGLAWGASLLVKPILLYLAAPLVAVLVVVRRRAAWYAVGAFVIALAIATPWVLRNRAITGRFIPVVTGAWEIVVKGDAYSENVLRSEGAVELEGMAKARLAEIDRDNGVSGEPLHEREPLYRRYVITRIFEDPVALLQKMTVQSLTLWVLGGDHRKTFVFAALQLPVLLLVGFAIASSRSTRHRMVGFATVAVYLWGAYAFSLAMARYSMPLRPWMVLIGIGFAAAHIQDHLRARRPSLVPVSTTQ